MLVKYSGHPETKKFECAVGADFDDFMGKAGLYQLHEPQIGKNSRLPAPYSTTLN